MKFHGREWVKQNKKDLILKFADTAVYLPEVDPVTTFMAGTPGAGKTEFSVKLIESFNTPVVRIDADEIRELMPGYVGTNSQDYQQTVDKCINILYDHVRHKKQSVIIDGTFAYGNWRENIMNSLNRDRKVEIYYLYQAPDVAWEFCNKRASKLNGRVVPAEVFIKSYFTSLENISTALKEFPEIVVYFAENDYKHKLKNLKIGVKDIKSVLPRLYTEKELRDIIEKDDKENI